MFGFWNLLQYWNMFVRWKMFQYTLRPHPAPAPYGRRHDPEEAAPAAGEGSFQILQGAHTPGTTGPHRGHPPNPNPNPNPDWVRRDLIEAIQRGSRLGNLGSGLGNLGLGGTP